MVAATWVVASTRISRASSQIAATTVFEWLTGPLSPTLVTNAFSARYPGQSAGDSRGCPSTLSLVGIRFHAAFDRNRRECLLLENLRGKHDRMDREVKLASPMRCLHRAIRPGLIALRGVL